MFDAILMLQTSYVEQVRDEGRKAFREHKVPNECPYIVGTGDWHAWREGWFDQRAITREV